MKVENWPISKPIPYSRNPRRNEAAISKVAGSIKEFGWRQPIVVDTEGVIIAGHTRLLAAQHLRLQEVPVHVATDLSPQQIKAYRLADNRVAQEAEWDNDLLKLELSELEEEGFSLDLTGFSEDELEALLAEGTEDGLTDEDSVPEVGEQSVTVEGDVWLLGRHRLMCGDSTSIDAVEKLMDGKKADMVFTDPPYGMHLNADYSSAKARPDMAKAKGLLGGKKWDDVIGDHDDFTPELINTVFACFPDCQEVFLWGADYYAEMIPNKNDGSWVVWDKRLEESTDKMYGSSFELCWSKSKHKRDIARIKWAGVFGVEQEHDKQRSHPTQKPTALAEWFFERWGKKGDVVADIYAGSGFTFLAAEKTGRKCYGMELDPKYCDVIIKRWQDFTGKEAILESSGKTFAEVEAERKG